MFIATILLIALLIGVAVLLLITMRRRGRDPMPLIISRDSAQRHPALVCLVRGVELLIAVVLLGGLMLIFAGSLLAVDPWRAHPGLSKAYAIAVMIAVPLVLVTACVVLPARRHWTQSGVFFRDILRIDSNSVATFAFIFAAFSAHDFYQLWPFRISVPVDHDHSPFLNREFLYLIVFFGLWYGVKNLIFRILEFRPKDPPEHLAPPVPSHGW